jgi:xylulokinase
LLTRPFNLQSSVFPMFLGLDLGTNALKAGLFDAHGTPLHTVRLPYPIHYLADAGAEQNPEDWWRNVCDAIGMLLTEKADPRGVKRGNLAGLADVRDIAALCVIGQGPTLVVCDDELRPRARALLWADRRDHPERVRLSEKLGYEVSAYALLPKVSWLARKSRSATSAPSNVFAKGARVMQAYDFIAARLAGHVFTSQFGPWPPFSADEFARAELDPSWIPPIVPMGKQVGVTREPWCREAHLPTGIPIIAGVYDSAPTTLGAALVVTGRACDFGGMSGGYGLCWHEPLSAEGIAAWPGLCEGQYLVGGATASAGTNIAWLAKMFGGMSVLNEAFTEAENLAAGSDRLICLPYFVGERAPIWDDEVRGALVGLGLHHRRAHVARALLEGIAFGLRHIAHMVTQAGGRMDELRVCGGTAHTELLNRIKADMLGVPVCVPQVIEASLLGAAMMAAVGVGAHRDYVTATQAMVHIARTIEPEAARHAKYDEMFARFLELTQMRLK